MTRNNSSSRQKYKTCECLFGQYEWAKYDSGSMSVWTTGHAFINGVLLKGAALAEKIGSSLNHPEDIAQLLASISGTASFILIGPKSTCFSVDHIRSFPLYYQVKKDKLVLSDSFHSLSGDYSSIDYRSAAEYAASGFVTGARTMVEGIYSTQAGEFCTWSEGTLTATRHYSYICTYEMNSNENRLCAEFDAILTQSMERALAYCDGRQIALPLSGGLDSRILATSLKRLGYENVITFAYGLPDNFESRKSRKVAQQLGFKWIHVPYDKSSNQYTLFSPEALDYQKKAHGGVSIPFIDDWGALKQLRDNRITDENAVLMPGHTGDFICGSHLKYLFDPKWNQNPRQLADVIISKHFSMWENLLKEGTVKQRILDGINEQIEKINHSTAEGLAAAYEYHEWQERQAKYILNSARCYEHHNFDWYCPLWDKAIVEFWRHISIQFKMDSYLYKKYLSSYDSYKLFQDDTPAPLWQSNADGFPIPSPNNQSPAETKRQRAPKTALGLLWQRHKKHKHYLRKHASGFPNAYGKWVYTWRGLDKRHHLALLIKCVLQNIYGIQIKDIPKVLQTQQSMSNRETSRRAH